MNESISWESYEFEHRPKDVLWYWLSIVCAIGFFAFALWQKNYFFAVFIVMAEILIIVWGNREPKKTAFTITKDGLRIGENIFHHWIDFESFSLLREPHLQTTELSLFFKQHFKTPLEILLPENKAIEIEKFLSRTLPEIEASPSLLSAIERFLHF